MTEVKYMRNRRAGLNGWLVGTGRRDARPTTCNGMIDVVERVARSKMMRRVVSGGWFAMW
jgi:hypothetical protein